MKIVIFFVLILLFKVVDSDARDTKMDSLQNLLKTVKEDTNKVKILYELSDECAQEDILKYAIPALKLAEKLNFKKGIADALNNIGYFYYSRGDLSLSLEYYYKSLKIREEIGDREGIAGSFNNIAVVYNNRGDVLKALEYHDKSLKAQQNIGNKEGVATSLNNIGFIYKNQGNTSKALDYYFKSLKMYEDMGDKEGVATSYNNISSLYVSQGNYDKSLGYDQKSLKMAEEAGYKFGVARSLNNIGLYYSHEVNIPRAFEYFQKSLAIHEEIGNKPSISTVHKNMAQLYTRQGNFSKAIEYYTKSLQIAEEMGDKRLIAAILSELGNINLTQKNYKQATAYCKQALQIGQDMGNPESIKGASGNLSEIYSVEGKYKEAYQMHVLFKQMSDSVSNVETRKSTVKKEMQYEFDRRETALKAGHEKKETLAAAEIKRQTVIRNFTFTGFGLAGIFSFFLIGSSNRRKKIAFDIQVLEIEKQYREELLKVQLETQEQALQYLSDELHDNLGQVASLIKLNLHTIRLSDNIKEKEKLENTINLTRQLITDIKSLSVSLSGDHLRRTGLLKAIETEVEQINKTEKFIATFTLENDIPHIVNDKAIILYRMTQEVLNNMVKHSEAKEIKVKLLSTENSIILALSDDGKGFEVEEKLKNGSGAGLHNLYKRAALINAALTIQSSYGNGTKVTIELARSYASNTESETRTGRMTTPSFAKDYQPY
jgi:signal transduction histidine kinase